MPPANRDRLIKFLLPALLLLLVLSGATGCSWLKGLFGEEGEEIDVPPQELAQQGIENLQAGRYSMAIDFFQKLKDRHPYSRYAILADLKIADALYLRESYIEATAAYEEFERLHPKNEAVPYVIYQQGMCHFNLVKGYDRDQVPTVRAIQTFTRLQQTFPDSKFSSMALARITEAQNNLAHHEFYIAEFYYDMEAYRAALGRFISLVKTYPDTGYHNLALAYIKVCRQKVAELEAEEAEEAARQKFVPESEDEKLKERKDSERYEGQGDAGIGSSDPSDRR